MSPRTPAATVLVVVALWTTAARAQDAADADATPQLLDGSPEVHRDLSLWPQAPVVSRGSAFGWLREGELGAGRTVLFVGVDVEGSGRTLDPALAYAPASAAAVFAASVSFDLGRDFEVRLQTAARGSSQAVGASATAALVWWFSRRIGLQLGVTGYVGTSPDGDVMAPDPIADFAREDALIRAMEGQDHGDVGDVLRAVFSTAIGLVGR